MGVSDYFFYVRDTAFRVTTTAFSTVSPDCSSLPYLLETVLTHDLSVSDFQFLPSWSESDLTELSAWCVLWRLLLSTPPLFSLSLQLLIHQFSSTAVELNLPYLKNEQGNFVTSIPESC